MKGSSPWQPSARLAEEVAREALPKQKAGVVCVKLRKGKGTRSPMLVVCTADVWRALHGDAQDPGPRSDQPMNITVALTPVCALMPISRTVLARGSGNWEAPRCPESARLSRSIASIARWDRWTMSRIGCGYGMILEADDEGAWSTTPGPSGADIRLPREGVARASSRPRRTLSHGSDWSCLPIRRAGLRVRPVLARSQKIDRPRPSLLPSCDVHRRAFVERSTTIRP